MTVLNHDDIIDFKSMAYFLGYAKVLSGKCYEDTNNKAPSSSKSNKVKWSNIVKLSSLTKNQKQCFSNMNIKKVTTNALIFGQSQLVHIR